MRAVVIVLWQPGDPWRERLWAYARARWEAIGLEVIEGTAANLWQCRNAGARAAGAWDAAIFADADIVLAAPEQAHAALAKAVAANAYTACYSELDMLSEDDTRSVLAGANPNQVGVAHQWFGVWIGAYAIGRALWDDLGGYDERFAPYAGQDIAIIQAAGTLGGLDRVPGTAYHLWHESAPARGRAPGEGTGDLWPRYTAATHHPEKMRELLAPLKAQA